MKNLVTGATGLLGSHIVDQLVREGEEVRCLVRRTSDTRFLDALNVEKVYGDITEPNSLPLAFKNIDIVYHCAAKVSDWGRRGEFERTNVGGTQNCLEGALHAKVGRFVHVSTEGIYGYHLRYTESIDEMFPFAENLSPWNHYDWTKILAEELVWRFARSKGLVVTVIRPGWIYGPRYNFPFSRAVRFVKSPLAALIAGGTNHLNLVHAADVANAAILAARNEIAVNQVYNVQSDEKITAKDFFCTLTSLINGRKISNRSVNASIAYVIATLMEVWGRLRKSRVAPLLTRYAVVGISCNNIFSADKAKRELGWHPRISFKEGIREAVAWCLENLDADDACLKSGSTSYEAFQR